MSSRRKVRDKWRSKEWYRVLSPEYFGKAELGLIPADDPSKLIGRVVESTLYDLTGDFSHQHLKLKFQIQSVDGKVANTTFKGHEYSRDYLRSLVRRRTSFIDGVFDVTTKDGYRVRVFACGFTLVRVKSSQERAVRKIMSDIIKKKAEELNFAQFVQEIVLDKLASDIYNEAKKVVPLRHVGIRKTKLLYQPKPEEA